jgi:hypothetical protein
MLLDRARDVTTRRAPKCSRRAHTPRNTLRASVIIPRSVIICTIAPAMWGNM